MSEFTNKSVARAKDLSKFMSGLIEGKKGSDLVKEYKLITENYIPADVLSAFDMMFDQNVDIEDLKTASNKLFNILYKTLSSYPAIKAKTDTFIYFLEEDNRRIISLLESCKPLIKQINKEKDANLISSISLIFKQLQKIDLHYRVKENILFPVLERKWENHQCLKLMWSFHDDIRKNLKATIDCLEAATFDLQHFNKTSSRVFFNVHTIIFREEKILFPLMLENMGDESFDEMLKQTIGPGLAFVRPEHKSPEKHKDDSSVTLNDIKLKTGNITPEQIELIFKYLPVDITYVDENDKVVFYSDPPHRIFPRTPSIIGRKLQNCHPPESVGIVNNIVESFRKNEKDEASFWIHLGPKYVLIKYFAVRDGENNFKGTLEVSQEISEIQKIEGDRRLLDW
ncbi:MAG: DUF438 domain-containing protein [Chlorobi bacterium]|nr:DUF438 domain-containing protein [Chlorobiota bacterium]